MSSQATSRASISPHAAAAAAQIQRAARGYKDIHLLAFKLLRPGGRLMTFSCSGGVGPELFEQIVAGAAGDAGAPGLIGAWLRPPGSPSGGGALPRGTLPQGPHLSQGDVGLVSREDSSALSGGQSGCHCEPP